MNEDQLIELEEYADLEGSELGEVVHLLLRLNQYQYGLSDEFKKALASEIESIYRLFANETKIIEREVISKRIVKELVWSDGNRYFEEEA